MWKLVCTLNLLWSRSKLIPQNKGIRFFELRFKHCRVLSSGLGQVSVSSVQIVFSLASVKRELCARCSTWERPRPICFKKAARKQETLRFQLWFFRGKRYKYLSLSLSDLVAWSKLHSWSIAEKWHGLLESWTPSLSRQDPAIPGSSWTSDWQWCDLDQIPH